MRLLIDTHVLLWAAAGDKRLSHRARREIASTTNELYLSSASAWEILLKEQAGRLRVPGGGPDFLERRVKEGRLIVLPITWRHVLAISHLPPHHRDPFDRLLVAQCQIENLPILSADSGLARYAVDVIW